MEKSGAGPAASADFALDDSGDATAAVLKLDKSLCGRFDLRPLLAVYPAIKAGSATAEEELVSCSFSYAKDAPERLSGWMNISDRKSARLARFTVRGLFVGEGEEDRNPEVLADFAQPAFVVARRSKPDANYHSVSYNLYAQADSLTVDFFFIVESASPLPPNDKLRPAVLDAARNTLLRVTG
ncbi:hypothetical protein AB0M43_22700 [Longispora sp. NPDC051575]|uniref:hypothetical protein n=1 Tax=Longispora sp. NPDC051575 TaxID=3154943 RepID=UPI003435A10D